MSKTKKSNNKTWIILLAVVLAAAIAFAAYFFINKEENTDYTNEDTYIGLRESDAVERAEKSGLEYSVVDYDKRFEVGIVGTTELVLYVSEEKVIEVYLNSIPGKPQR